MLNKVKVYLLIGVPGSGKSWVCSQLTDKFTYLPHDDYAKREKYLEAILEAHKTSKKPLLIETPFSIEQIVTPLKEKHIPVEPVFIIESDMIISKRYKDREGKPIIPGHLTRQKTYLQRAKEADAFIGTSKEVLKYLKQV